jgi:hypothetical protein
MNERNAEIIRLWNLNITAQEIGKRLGGGHTQHDHRRRDTGQSTWTYHTANGNEPVPKGPHGQYRKIWI